MNIKIVMTVKIGDADYVVSDACRLEDEHRFHADEHASDMVMIMAEKIKSAINPCYFDHDIIAEAKKSDNND